MNTTTQSPPHRLTPQDLGALMSRIRSTTVLRGIAIPPHLEQRIREISGNPESPRVPDVMSLYSSVPYIVDERLKCAQLFFEEAAWNMRCLEQREHDATVHQGGA